VGKIRRKYDNDKIQLAEPELRYPNSSSSLVFIRLLSPVGHQVPQPFSSCTAINYDVVVVPILYGMM
jgi:hypothetical protein